MDYLTKEELSRVMSRIRGKNTKPEMSARKIVWNLGFRYRLHDKTLPGSPDIVFKRLRKVIFINGCFWHGHACRTNPPKSNSEFWRTKIERNKKRDRANLRKLTTNGWKYLVIWECELKKKSLVKRITMFLSN